MSKITEKHKTKAISDLVELFKSSDSIDHRTLYYDTQCSILDAITNGDLTGVKDLASVVEEVNVLINKEIIETYNQGTENPLRSQDLVTVACKHSSLEMLNFILDNDGYFLRQVYGTTKNIPSISSSGEHHNCFYYAMRANNLAMLNVLLHSFPSSYYIQTLQELDQILGETYEELKTKQIPLTPQIEFAVEQKIIGIRFYNENPEEARQMQFETIGKRIVFLLEIIEILGSNHADNGEPSQKDLLILKYVVFNVHVLKRQLKNSYNHLPWEEIEFSAIMFIYSHQKKDPNNLFYKTVLSRHKIMKHLNNFAIKLKSLVNSFRKTSPLKKLFQSVKSERETVVAEIVKNSPEFSELYEDFQRIRDVYSLQQMSDAINLAVQARPQVVEEKLVIIRALQILGECLKNTLDSPKLSHSLSKFLIALAPTNTKEIITTLRDSLSHVDSLNIRLEVENNSSDDYFFSLQDDVKKLGNVIISTLHNIREKLLKELLSKIITDDVSSIMQHNQTNIIISSQKDRKKICVSENPFRLLEHDTNKMIVQKLKNMMSDKTETDWNAFRNIDAILNQDEINNTNRDMNHAFNKAFRRFILPVNMENARCSAFITKFIKTNADNALKMNRKPQRNINSIAQHLIDVKNSLCSSKPEDNDVEEFFNIMSSIIDPFQLETKKIEWIEILKERLHKVNNKKAPPPAKPNEAAEKPNYSQLFNSKMSKLQTFLKDPVFDFTLEENLLQYKGNLLHQSIIDMFLLDILSLLGEVGKLLPDNVITSIDDNTCLLIGRNLRNHIAHFNTYTEVLPSSTSGAVIINALKFISDQVPFDCPKKIGKMQKSDPQKLQNKFQREMDFVELQMSMFEKLEKGDLEGLMTCVSRGADLFSRNSNMMTTIHCAAKGTSLDVIKYLVTQNVDVSLKDSDGCSALHIAAMHGRANTVEYLLTAVHLDINAPNNKGATPLHFAAMYGRHEVVKMLLQANADICFIDVGNLLPIYYAIVNNHIDIVELLIEHYEKANLPVLKIYGDTLHMAIFYGNIEIVELLIQKGCDVNEVDDDGMSSLQIAALVGHIDIVRTLIQYGAQTNRGHLSLICAVASGNIDIVKFFLENGGNPNVCFSSNFRNLYPLHLAMEHGPAEVISLLIHYQADVNTTDSKGRTALHIAAMKGNKEFVEMLIHQKALVNIQTCTGRTPLHYATERQHMEIVETLIRNNASVNIGDCENITPLTLAAVQGNLEIVKILLENGGRLDQYSVDGFTPLHYCTRKGHTKLSEFLISRETDVIGYSSHFPVLHMAAISGDAEVTKLLLEVGVNVDEVDKLDGSTALGVAASYGHINVIAVLLERGADIDAYDYFYRTPLFNAAKKNHIETCKFLLQKGASIKIITPVADPLKAAIFLKNFEIVDSLIKNHAEVDESSLKFALHQGNANIINLLLQNITCKLEDPRLLCFAVNNSIHSLVESLLRLGVDCNSTYRGKTPIICAAERGNTNAASLLILHGADVNKVSDDGDTALHLAVQEGHSHFVNLLLVNAVDINKTNKHGKMAIEVGISRLAHEFKEMLANDITKFIENYGEWSLLNLPELRERCDVVQLLLDFGAEANKSNYGSWDPLQSVIHKESGDVTGILLSPQNGEYSWFIVHYAVSIRNLELLECILHHNQYRYKRSFWVNSFALGLQKWRLGNL